MFLQICEQSQNALKRVIYLGSAESMSDLLCSTVHKEILTSKKFDEFRLQQI